MHTHDINAKKINIVVISTSFIRNISFKLKSPLINTWKFITLIIASDCSKARGNVFQLFELFGSSISGFSPGLNRKIK